MHVHMHNKAPLRTYGVPQVSSSSSKPGVLSVGIQRFGSGLMCDVAVPCVFMRRHGACGELW